ncbi:hypothetical protein AX17_004439 [Amanita inopinata Kibby_2008]|nr:hypothetical protein AX17_004439 [Amanita inopinata Kibby_2008]
MASSTPHQGEISPTIGTWQLDNVDEDSEVPDSDHPGDYSSRMEELFDDGDDELETHSKDEEFLYTGMDANNTSTGYHDQLRDILGPELGDNEDDSLSRSEIEDRTIMIDETIEIIAATTRPVPLHESELMTAAESPAIEKCTVNVVQQSRPPHPFLHPSVSRLRSFTPGSVSLTSSDVSSVSAQSPPTGALSVSSHFSSMSRESSRSVLRVRTPDVDERDLSGRHANEAREVFKWADLASITHHFYPPQSQKVTSVLGIPPTRSPTVLAANGLICVGADDGTVHVYDFKQTLKCICGIDLQAKEKAVGRVTAVALSHDHTYVASGHATGHIFLYNLNDPHTPARSIPPTTLAVVATGRKEGHLQASRIVNIGFIGARHTALVSADEHGLVFYHNLGKVFFVEASDTLRILGRYPEPEQSTNGQPRILADAWSRRKMRYTILAMAPLPLGVSPHVTDSYHVIAMLTPTKLVVVGLRPSPRTWFKCPRGLDEGGSRKSGSKWRGTLAWYPSMTSTIPASSNGNHADTTGNSLDPILAYTWGNSVHLIKITETRAKQVIRNSRNGKTKSVEVGRIVFEDLCKWSTQDDVLSLQWLNANQLVVFTSTALQVLDARNGNVIEHIAFDSVNLVSLSDTSIANGKTLAVDHIAHSVRVYKGKIFLLSRDKFQVGTLMTWADQILSCVQQGDFLGAIELARSYYVDEAPGNRNGLPSEQVERRNVIGQRMRGLMRASAQYVFSEDRMTDDTHVTPDHRGVDRTSLFEDLVTVSCRACIALGDFDFLFEDLFQQYDDSGIARIYLLQLQPFVLNNSIHYVPPRITQRLVALHEEDGHPDCIEHIIWHIDPACLDINQAIVLCQKHHLYDALVYIYTCALRDYVAPIVEFLGIIRQKMRVDAAAHNAETFPELVDDALFQNAYKIYPYLETILTGHIYPSNKPLEEEESLQAKKDIYSFLFSGRSCVWPRTGEEAQLVLTSLEEGGLEPTFPYVRQLLRFDSEWFLHSLDKAFEKAFLDDEVQIICQSITKVLLEILSSNTLNVSDATFIRIFAARNIPKYPQFLHVPPSTLCSVLIGLAEVKDPKTREDRQLAAESLLSVHHPDDMEYILRLFTEAGFYRILRQQYLQRHHWSALLSTYLDDSGLENQEVIGGINHVFAVAQSSNRGILPPELVNMLETKLATFLGMAVEDTAILINKYQPQLHDIAIGTLEDDVRRFKYLQKLLRPNTAEGEAQDLVSVSRPARTMPDHLYQMYLSLQCRFEPKKVVDILQILPSELLDQDQTLQTCESHEVYEAVIWTLNRRNDPQAAIAKAESYQKRLLTKALDLDGNSKDMHKVIEATKEIVHMGITVCLHHSSANTSSPSQPEDLWFQLFKSQIYCIQLASGMPASIVADVDSTKSHRLLLSPSLRSLVQETFGALVSIASAKTVSFPRLFKRLVESVSSSTRAHYTEFQSILTGMLESYRSDGDMLVITKQLVNRDLFETVASYTRERAKGWAPSNMACIHCRKPVYDHTTSSNASTPVGTARCKIVVSQTGTLYHLNCSLET